VHDGDVRHQGGTHLTCLRTIDGDLGCIWARVGKLGSMPKVSTCLPLKRLGDPISTSMISHNDRHERAHKERVAYQGMGCTGPRDMTIDGCMGFYGEGSNMSIDCDDQRRHMTHLRDMMFHTSDP